MEKVYALTTCARYNCANKKYLIGNFAAKIHSAMGENVLSFAPSGSTSSFTEFTQSFTEQLSKSQVLPEARRGCFLLPLSALSPNTLRAQIVFWPDLLNCIFCINVSGAYIDFHSVSAVRCMGLYQGDAGRESGRAKENAHSVQFTQSCAQGIFVLRLHGSVRWLKEVHMGHIGSLNVASWGFTVPDIGLECFWYPTQLIQHKQNQQIQLDTAPLTLLGQQRL